MKPKIGMTLGLVAGFFCSFMCHGESFQTSAKQAILLDAQTGVTLYEQKADELMIPSSMTKIMTIYMIFKRLKEKRLSLEDTFYVSEKAWRKGGSKMFVELGAQVSVRNLISGILVASGNDACIVASEGLSGTEKAFVNSMNESAHEIGARSVHFLNSNGWPDQGHTCTTRDLAIIAQKTIEEFPHLYKQFYAMPEFTYNKIRQRNLNPLLYHEGMTGDGFKTGHTEAGGYGLVGSATTAKGRRLIMVVNGLPSKKARREESLKLIQYGARAFDTFPIFRKGDLLGKGDVWLGDKPALKLTSLEDIWVTVESHERDNLKVELVMEGPIQAPVKAGDTVAKLVVSGSSVQKSFQVPVMAAESVGKVGILGRLKAAALYLMLGHTPKDTESTPHEKR